MKNLKTLLLSLIFFSIVPTFVSAQEYGCEGPITGNYYTKFLRDEGGYKIYGTNVVNDPNYTDNCNGRDASKYTLKVDDAPGKCKVNWYGFEVEGKRHMIFTRVQCPIDDYIPALVLAMAGAGFFLIRRKDLAI